MDSFVSNMYNFVTSTVVPAAIEQTTNLVGGAASALSTIGKTALEWGSGSEDATASAEVFSWETSRGDVEKTSEAVTKASEPSSSSDKKPGNIEDGNTSWEFVEETPEETGPVKHNQFEMVQNDYDWMRNSK